MAGEEAPRMKEEAAVAAFKKKAEDAEAAAVFSEGGKAADNADEKKPEEREQEPDFAAGAVAAGGSSEVGGNAAAAASASVDDATAEDAASDGEEDKEKINWVEMPLEHVHWILAKKRESDPVPTLEDFGLYTQEDIDMEDADMLIRKTIASLRASQNEFFEYQAWVREVFINNGHVMVPEGVLGPKDQLQQAIDEDWYAMKDGAADSNTQEEALPSN